MTISFNRRFIWVGLLVAMVIVAIWSATSQPDSAPGPTAASPRVSEGKIKEISKENGLSFTPDDFVPLDFAPQGRFLLGSEPEGSILYQLNEQSIKALYTFDQPVIIVSISPDEKRVLIQTGRERLTSWQILELATNELQPLSDIVVADWDGNALMGVNGKRQVVRKPLNGAYAALPNQPTIFANTSLTLESVGGYTLISATRETEESPWPIYWVITPQQQVITVPLPNIVQAHLSPTGEQVLAYTVSDQTMQYFNVLNRQTGALDASITTTSVTGLDRQQNVFVSAPADTPKAWRVTTFVPGQPAKTKQVIAPVEWPAINFFLINGELYVLGSGHFIKVKLTDLLASQA